MPQEVSDIKQFIEICRRKDAKCMIPLSISLYYPRASSSSPFPSNATTIPKLTHKKKTTTAARIKRNRKTQQIKFKVRCHRFLYTLVLKDSNKADKLKQSLPPSTFSLRFPNLSSKGRETFLSLHSSDSNITPLKKKKNY